MTMTSKKGRLFIISAPSGAGKGTVIQRLLELRPELKLSVSATTRAPRAGEKDGVSYFFVTREKFIDMIARGEFLEHAEYVGEYYGTPKKPIYELIDAGKDVIIEIEVWGARQVMAIDPGAVSIFIMPPDMDELERRLRERGTDIEQKLAVRLECARTEIEHQGEYAHVVINDEVDRVAKEVLAIIDGE